MTTSGGKVWRGQMLGNVYIRVINYNTSALVIV